MWNLKPQTTLARRRTRAASAVAALSLIAGLMFAAPTIASVPAGHMMNLGTGRCLDSSYKGAVYLNPCWPNDNYQKWHLIFGGGMIVNNQTGRCLDANHHQGVFTNPCARNPTLRDASRYELWSSGAPASNLSQVTWENEGADAWALDANSHQGVFIKPYVSNDRYQTWVGVHPNFSVGGGPPVQVL